MGRFLELEKQRLVAAKPVAPYLSDAARADGVFRGKPRPFCLPPECASENLLRPIRAGALSYFARHGILWHQGLNGGPSNHLCDSQVACVNFLFPFASRPDELAQLLRPVFPRIGQALPIEETGEFVAFEFIGSRNFLGERVARESSRTRGANCTSTDAAVLFEETDGRRHLVLIEWKYTESYGAGPLHTAPSGTDRTAIYRHLYQRDDCPVDRSALADFGDLFYEPFYQFMRQQLLAHEMEREGELGAHAASVLHIAPARNRDFLRVTSPALAHVADTATGAWRCLLHDPSRFLSVNTEALFAPVLSADTPDLELWQEGIKVRYEWVTTG